MRWIALLCPAVLSLWICGNRRLDFFTSTTKAILKYGLYLLVDNWLTVLLITYGLGLMDVVADALESFPFFLKYTLIATVIAFIVPYVEEIVLKYIKVSFIVRTKDEEETTCKKDNQ